MKVGLVARSENRGLGNLTWEWAQHMQPERVLVVVPNHPIAQRLDRYPDATVLPWNHMRDSALDEQVVRDWLDGLDVVYSAETFYDWRMCDWAREQGVRTVCHVMPEYYRHHLDSRIPRPDAWWTPTRWRLSTLDPTTRVVPVPVAIERFPRSDLWRPASAATRIDQASATASIAMPEPCENIEPGTDRPTNSDADTTPGPTPTSISDEARSPVNRVSDAADQPKCTTTTTTGRSTSGGSADRATSHSTENVRRRTYDDGPLRSLHTVGTKAAADRNGTRIVLGALRYLIRQHDVTIRTQGQLVGTGQPAHGVRVRIDTTEADEYWQLYGDADDVLVLPRRYAGLSLPVLEAMAAGLAVVMPDVEPQRSEWPISAVPAIEGGYVRTAAHRITLAEVSPRVLAARMDWLADHPDEVRALQHSSRRFAESQSWHTLRPVIQYELERVLA